MQCLMQSLQFTDEHAIINSIKTKEELQMDCPWQ